MFLVGCTDSAPSWEPFSPHNEETPNTLTAPQCSARSRACWPGSVKSPIAILHLLETISTKNQSEIDPSNMPFSVQMEHCCILGLTFFPQTSYGQARSQSQCLLLDPDPCRSWEYKGNFIVRRAPRIYKLLKRNLKTPMTWQAGVPPHYWVVGKVMTYFSMFSNAKMVSWLSRQPNIIFFTG